MNSAARILTEPMTVDDFLAFLKNRPIHETWELVDGRAIAMVGATTAHQLIVGSVYRSLYPRAKSRGCDAFPGDLFVGGDQADFLAVPDVAIQCGKSEPGERILKYPSIIVEVLSPTTMYLDRGIKFRHYQSIESIQQIILIYQDQIRIESWMRQSSIAPDEDSWTLQTLTSLDESIILPSLDSELPLRLVYEDVALGQSM